ncbi:MAG: hypothetical protein GC191_07765 [Azospirillum sp.]|nr:hypothetical protein [Azospirillum sp.]
MRKLLIVLAVISATATPNLAQASLARDAGISCAYSGALLAAATYFGLLAPLGGAVVTWPAGSIIAQNALVGCAIGTAGTTAAHAFSWIYDTLFW